MKRLLLAIFIILPVFFLTIESVTPKKEVKISANSQLSKESATYNKKITKYLEESIIKKDFSGGEQYFDDELIVYSYSLEEFSIMSNKDMIDFFNEMVGTTKGHSYEIYYHVNDDGNNVYTMKYFYTYHEGENLVKDSITFYLTEINGTIAKVYGP